MMQVMQDRILMQDRIMYQVSHSLIGCVSIYRQICGFFQYQNLDRLAKLQQPHPKLLHSATSSVIRQLLRYFNTAA